MVEKRWMTIKKFTLALMSTGFFAGACAAGYPDKPLTLIVPFAAGGPTDGSARLFAKALEKQLGQSVVVENKAGAGGILGSTFVARAKPDGYTLLWGGTSTLAVAPHLYKNAKYDASSFTPIGMALKTPQMIAAHPSVKANNLKELVQEAKGKKLNLGTAGNGSLGHLGMEYFQNVFGVEFTHIPYKGGALAVSDLLGGQIDLTIDNASALLPYINAGKIKGIALAGNAPYALAPTIALVSEAAKGFEIYSWFGLAAHKETPKPIVDTLVSAMKKASNDEEVKTGLQKMGVEPGVQSVSEFAKIIQADSDKWKNMIRSADVKID